MTAQEYLDKAKWLFEESGKTNLVREAEAAATRGLLAIELFKVARAEEHAEFERLPTQAFVAEQE